MIEIGVKTIAKRVWSGLTTWPDRRMWLFSAGVFIAYAVLAWGIGFATGLYRFEPHLDESLVRVFVVAFFVPAIGEEVFFRGALIPSTKEKVRALPQILLALALFLAWHPINAWLFFPEVLPLFSNWRFLLVTALLGIACSYLWRTTRSLWPPIVLHWVAVVIWKAFLGAPSMM
jgi:uncharacterized protein